MMSERTKIVKDFVYFSGSSYVSQTLGIVTSVLIKMYLGPTLMGVWATLQVVLRYSLWSNMGILASSYRQIPYFLGKGDEREATRIRDTSFVFTLIMSCLVAIAIFVWSIINSAKYSEHVIFGLKMISFIIVATAIYNFYLSTLRGYKKFSFLSRLIVFNSLITMILVVVLVSSYSIYGLFFAILVSVLLSVVYAAIHTRYKIKFEVEPKRLIALLKIGIPLIFSGFVFSILMSIDKIMIVRILGAENLGFYTIAIMGVAYANTLPSTIGIVLFPRFQERFGANDNVEDIKKYLLKPVLVLSYSFPTVLGVIYFVVPVLVHYILPDFAPGITSFKILIIGCFFLSLTPISSNFLITLNKQLRVAGLTIIAVIVSILLNYYFIKVKGWGIEGAAIGTCIGYFSHFALLGFYSLSHFMKFKDMLRYLLTPFAVFLYLVAAILLLEYKINIHQVILEGMFKTALVIIFTLPILFWGNKEFGFFRHLKDAFNAKFRNGKA